MMGKKKCGAKQDKRDSILLADKFPKIFKKEIPGNVIQPPEPPLRRIRIRERARITCLTTRAVNRRR